MSALLVYRNSTPEVMEWADKYKARAKENADARFEWMQALYNTYDVPEDQRGAFVRGCEFSGISWPKEKALPDGWFRPVDTPQLVRPRRNIKAGKTAVAEMARFNTPDARRELRVRFGMPDFVFHGNGLYNCGVRMEDDGVWVTWGERGIADRKDMADVEQYGWVRVPLTAYIERFGEDAL